jgi:hypothetical protein
LQVIINYFVFEKYDLKTNQSYENPYRRYKNVEERKEDKRF